MGGLLATSPVLADGLVAGLVADLGDSVAQFVSTFLTVYILLLFAYVITSWIRLPYRPWLNRIQRFLYDVCDPYLRLFRRFIPPLGPLDLSPMLAIISLVVVREVLVSVIRNVL